MTDQERLAHLVETWRVAVGDFVALVRELPEGQWELPTDLPGWSVKDIVAHTAHLEAVLAGAPEETVEVPADPRLTSILAIYTEQGVLARQDRSMAELAAEIEAASATRLAGLRAHPPTDGAAKTLKTPGDVPWPDERLLSNRPLDVWMHEQDIRRALDLPGGFDSPAARHVVGVFLAGLPMVIGKKVAPAVGTTVRVVVPDLDPHAELATEVTMTEGGRAVVTTGETPTVTITMPAADFIVACGGRREPGGVAIDGDQELGRRVVAQLAMTP